MAEAGSGSSLGWTDLDRRAVDTARTLAMDAVQNTGNGHPGTAMSLAPAAYLLFQRILRHDPTAPDWAGRDRFVLSNGHSSLTLYVQLYLSGYGLELDDLKQLRKWGSLTPGHPEHGHTKGVETTTGPLGQGVGNAVGMAMAARRERGLFDPDAAPGESLFDHQIYAFCGDGDLEEGVSAEASSLAGHQQLGNLTLIYDDNKISIEDDTNIAFSEDVAKRYEAYGWHIQVVDWTDGGKGYHEDVEALNTAIEAAKAETSKPSFIVLRTIIGWPAPKLQNTGKAHGAALGEDEVAATKEVLGLDPTKSFDVADDVIAHSREVVQRGQAAHAQWQQAYDKWAAANPERKALHDRLAARALPEGWTDTLPHWDVDPKGVATRVASGDVLSAIAPVLPELWGGSADLAGSNNTTPKGEPSFVPAEHQTKMFTGGPYGRVLHFGIREHAMGSIMNGITLHGGTRVYGGTFLVFSDYMRGGGTTGRADEAAGHVRMDARLHRPRRGRPDAPADRAPVRAADHPGPGRRTTRRRQRDGVRLADHPGEHRPPSRPRAHPAERADPGRHVTGRRPARRVRLAGRLQRPARRGADRVRFGVAAGSRGAQDAGGRRR